MRSERAAVLQLTRDCEQRHNLQNEINYRLGSPAWQVERTKKCARRKEATAFLAPARELCEERFSISRAIPYRKRD